MSGSDSSQEKTEEPTRKKLEDARKKGQVVKSKEITSFFSLISIFAYFIFFQSEILHDCYLIHSLVLQSISDNALASTDFHFLIRIIFILVKMTVQIILVPVIVAASISGLVAMIQVGGVVITPEAMEIKFDKFNIVTNAKNIFSMKTLKKFIKDIIQLIIMIIVSYVIISGNIESILNSASSTLRVVVAIFFKILAHLFLYLLLIYFFFAVIDYILEYISFMKQMKMSLEEIKKEMKETEGSQQVKQRQQEIRQELAEEDSMASLVKNSTMIVTNPIHIAIGILYDPDKIKLPAVIFKATDKQLRTVKKLAKKYNILVIRDVWIARQLYELAELKKYVPTTMIAPVADLIGKYLHLLPKSLQESFARNVLNAPIPEIAVPDLPPLPNFPPPLRKQSGPIKKPNDP